jgi:signal transduction histidine kinase
LTRSLAPGAANRSLQAWAGGALALALAIGAGLLLTQLLMSPPGRDLRAMAGYLTLSGAATMAGGWLAIRTADRVVGLPLRVKAFFGSIAGTAVALLNVAIIAQLMFVSTSHDLKLLIALLVFSAVVTVFFSLWVAATVAARVDAAAAAIRALAAGDYQSRADIAGGDEVAQLAADVNALAARLSVAQEQRQALDRERHELTASISHDLRTPLASVRAMVEALADGVVVDPAETHRYFAIMRREVERLDRMIEDLFELAQLDAGALRLQAQRLRLQEVAAEVVDAMQARARQRDVSLTLRMEGQPPGLLLDGARIERAVSNLVRNAVEYTPPGGRVSVRVFADDGCVALRVSDSGEGIDEGDLPRIWERFYRAEKSRQRADDGGDGAGLGLAIVKGVVEAHGGSVDAGSAPGEGATFTIRLPRD